MKKISNLTIIDVSSLLYSTCYVCGKDDNLQRNNFEYYKDSFDNRIFDILKYTDADKYLIFGDGYTSFRKQMYSTFKGKRSKEHIQFMTDLKYYAIKKWNIYTSNILESDDLCLLHHNRYQDEYNVTIAAIDSDFNQYPAKFFNFGYYRKGIQPEEAFTIVDEKEAEFNLWRQVIIKGHNDKIDYLKNCGEKCAEKYLSNYSINQYKLATLNAFIVGISKSIHKVRSNIKGYGLTKGIKKYSNAFVQTYLLRTEEEALEIDEEFKFLIPNEIVNLHHTKNNLNLII
jgi:5'-3' exonuclease